MSLPSYPEYRASGVEWLGPIPTHWETDRLKRRCAVFPSNVDKKSVEGEASVRLCNYTDVYYNDRIGADMSFMEATASDEQIRKFTLRAGDTIFTKDSETADDIGIASNVPADMPDVVCGYHLSIARPLPNAQAHGAYVKRLFDAHYTKARFAVLANGLTRVGLNQYAVDNIELPWPPLEEQVSIASFLDRETAKIDALIAEQEKLLALLAEKRQATIFHAVTRGLNPNAPMKDSGIPWLGKVPAHWGISAFRRIVREIRQGWSPNASAEPCSGEGWGVLKISAIKNGSFIEEENKALLDGTLPDESICVLPGDLLVTRANTLPLVGDCCIVPEGVCPRLMLSDLIYRLQLNAGCAVNFFDYFLRSKSGRAQIECDARGSSMTMAKISQRHILGWIVPVPPCGEQIEIAEFLDTEAQRLGAGALEIQRGILLLKERRSALISAAVTGKIDVRQAA